MDVFDASTWRKVLEEAKRRLTTQATKDGDFSRLLDLIATRLLGDRPPNIEVEELLASMQQRVDEQAAQSRGGPSMRLRA
jgi:hypothetical protein